MLISSSLSAALPQPKYGLLECWNNGILGALNVDELVKGLLERHPGESRGPEHHEITGFRLSPE